MIGPTKAQRPQQDGTSTILPNCATPIFKLEVLRFSNVEHVRKGMTLTLLDPTRIPGTHRSKVRLRGYYRIALGRIDFQMFLGFLSYLLKNKYTILIIHVVK